jgi:hypothetical protein
MVCSFISDLLLLLFFETSLYVAQAGPELLGLKQSSCLSLLSSWARGAFIPHPAGVLFKNVASDPHPFKNILRKFS